MKAVRAFIAFLIVTQAMSFNAPAQTVTDVDLPGLQNVFNSMQGTTRVIFIGDPTCGQCVSSVSDLQTFIFNTCDNPDLRALIVWVHMSGWPSTRTNAVAQSSSWSDPRVTFYWDSLWDISYGFGYQGGWAGCNWAWDIAMIYPGTETWAGAYPPAPYYCMSKTGCCNPWVIHNLYGQLTTLGACYNTTGADENFSSPASFSVNPTTGFITFRLPEPEKKSDAEIAILDMLGKPVIQTKNKNRINISDLTGGIYFLTVSRGNKFYSAKFVKE